MSRLVARLLLAMLLLPLSGGLVALAMIGFARRPAPPSPREITAMWAVVYAFVGVYWLVLWRDGVRWTAARKTRTLLAGMIAAMIGATIGVTFGYALSPPKWTCYLVGGGMVPLLWLFMTIHIWRETPHERMKRLSIRGDHAVSCPHCGYNMTGLGEARCPECGSIYTLDELWAAHTKQGELGVGEE